jgi:peptide/nickel transport system permease protein
MAEIGTRELILPRQRFARRARRNRSFVIGLAIIAFYLFIALLGPALAPHDPYEQEIANKLEAPSAVHLLGRDELGRDLLSRILYGGRYSLAMAGGAVLVGLSVGITLGSIAGFFGGWLDALIMRIVDGMLAFPGLLLAMAVVTVLGRGLTNMALAVGLATIPGFIRLVRACFLSLREEEYVKAAVAVGVRDSGVIVHHILPNAMAPILVQTTYNIAGALLAASGLSFLGLGAQPPLPEWGVMLSRGRDYMRMAPHLITIPGLVIAVCILGLNLLGDGLRDILDPRLVD